MTAKKNNSKPSKVKKTLYENLEDFSSSELRDFNNALGNFEMDADILVGFFNKEYIDSSEVYERISECRSDLEQIENGMQTFEQVALEKMKKSKNATKSKPVKKEYRVSSDREGIDIDLMDGSIVLRVSDSQSGFEKNYTFDLMNLPWQVVGELTAVLGDHWDEIPQFVAIENSLTVKYDEEWKAFDEQMRSKSAKKSKPSINDQIAEIRNKSYSYQKR